MSAWRNLPVIVLAAIGLVVGAAGAIIVLALLPDDGTNSASRLLIGYAVWVVIAVGTLVLGNRVLARRRSDRDRPVVTARRDAPAGDDSGSADR